MTTYYVDSAGSNTSPYDTKAKAATLFSTIMALDAAGDTIYIADTHTETPTGPITQACAGTLAAPSKILCINFGTDALSTGAILGSTTTYILTGSFYCYGVIFKAGIGSGSSTAYINIGGVRQFFEECSFYLAGTYTTLSLFINNGTHNTTLTNCKYHFAHASQTISLYNGRINIRGLSPISGTAASSGLFRSDATWSVFAVITGVDVSLAATAVNIVNVTSNNQQGLVVLSNIKTPTSWSGALTNGAPLSDFQIIGSNIGAADANYYSASQSYAGKHINDTALYPSTVDGAEHNGAIVRISHKITTNANAEYPTPAFYSLDYPLFNTVTTSQTATIEIIHNEAAALTDAEVWLELEYLGTSASSQSSFIDDAVADVLAAAADQTTSTADWDDGLTARANSTVYATGNLIKLASNTGRAFICTVGGTSAGSEPAGYATAVDGDTITDNTATFKAMRRQKVNVTFTAAEQGPIIARIAVARASAVVWVSTKLVIS